MQGVACDPSIAAEWYKKAADAGSEKAKGNLDAVDKTIKRLTVFGVVFFLTIFWYWDPFNLQRLLWNQK